MSKNKQASNKFLGTWWGVLIAYTILWLIGALFIYVIFKLQGRVVLWLNDGAYQHFTSFNYTCDILHQLFRGGSSVSADLFNTTIGQGADIITTLNSYDFTNPIQWLCAGVFFVSRLARYKLMLFVNLYLIGAAFIFYCRSSERRNGLAVVAGSIAYVFSGAVLCMFMRHPNYINWAYFLPLMLGAYELFRRRGRRLPLIIVVALHILVSFYTFYMNAIFLAIYVVIILISHRDGSTFKSEFLAALKALGLCAAGVLLAAVVFFPTIYAFMINARVAGVSGYTDSFVYYPFNYYKQVLQTLFQPRRDIAFSTNIGLAAAALPFVVALFAFRRRFTRLKIWVILCAVMLAVPFAGRVMNGFGYVVNRWVYIIPLLCSVIIVDLWPYVVGTSGALKRLSSKTDAKRSQEAQGKLRGASSDDSSGPREVTAIRPDGKPGRGRSDRKGKKARNGRAPGLTTTVKLIIGILSLLYIAACLFFARGGGGDRILYITLAVVAVAVGLFVLFISIKTRARQGFVFALIIVCAAFQVWGTFSAHMSDYTGTFITTDRFHTLYDDSSDALSYESTEDNFFRTESRERRVNINGINEVRGTDIWWSMLPSYYLETLNSWELNDVSYNCTFRGLDGRTSLLELAAVRYYTNTIDSGVESVPYGYEYSTALSDDDYDVFENRYALLAAYTSRGLISREEYDSMSAIERQHVLLDGIMLEQKDIDAVNAALAAEPARYMSLSGAEAAFAPASSPEIIRIPIEFSSARDVDLADDFADTYIYPADTSAENASAKGGSYVDAGRDGTISFSADIPEGCEIYLRLGGLKLLEPDDATVYVYRESLELNTYKIGKVTNMQNEWPAIRDGVTFNLGYGGSGGNYITLEFNSAAEYEFGSIELLAVPMDDYEAKVTELNRYQPENLYVTGSRISCDIAADETRLMQFALPYSTGWSAIIDGSKADVFRSDGMYMAVLVPAGSHHIELLYRTPYMFEGAVVSVMTLIAIIVFAIVCRRKSSASSSARDRQLSAKRQ